MQLLTWALTGKLATLLTTFLSPEVKASYPLSKETLLASVGLSFHHYVDELFTPHKANDTTPAMALHHSSTVAKFIFKDANTLDDAIWTITKLHKLRQYTPECVQTVLKQDPCKPHEHSTAIRHFDQIHGDSTRVKPTGDPSPHTRRDTHSCTTSLTPYLDPNRNHRTGPTTLVNRGGQMVPGDLENIL